MWFTFSKMKVTLNFQGAFTPPQCHRFPPPPKKWPAFLLRLWSPPWFWRWNPGYQNHPIGKERHLNQATIFRFRPLIFEGDASVSTSPFFSAPKDPGSMYQWGWFPRMYFCSRPVARCLGQHKNFADGAHPMALQCRHTFLNVEEDGEFEFRTKKRTKFIPPKNLSFFFPAF